MSDEITWAHPKDLTFEAGLAVLFHDAGDDEIRTIKRQVLHVISEFKWYTHQLVNAPEPSELDRQIPALLKSIGQLQEFLRAHEGPSDEIRMLMEGCAGNPPHGSETTASLTEGLKALEVCLTTVASDWRLRLQASGRGFKLHGSGQTPLTSVLWSGLIDIWDSGKHVRAPKASPERLIRLVHGYLDLPPPSHDNLMKILRKRR